MNQESLKKVALTDHTILITGPTGTGKSTLAEKIHQTSPRRAEKFVIVNLATLNGNLLESELFGHERGAFSGAITRRIGKLEQADGGTVLLDEIAELSPDLQTRLLETLNSKKIVPVGSNREIRLNVRIIAATHQDLPSRVRAGLFRSDLLFRINAFPLELPALKETPKLILVAARSYLDELGAHDYEMDASFKDALTAHSWPGNFRELKNVIAFAHTISETKTLSRCHLPDLLQDPSLPTRDLFRFPMDFHEAKDRFERDFLTEMLHRHGGRVNRTARETRISKVTLIEKIRKFGIDVNAMRVSEYAATKQPDLVRYL